MIRDHFTITVIKILCPESIPFRFSFDLRVYSCSPEATDDTELKPDFFSHG